MSDHEMMKELGWPMKAPAHEYAFPVIRLLKIFADADVRDQLYWSFEKDDFGEFGEWKLKFTTTVLLGMHPDTEEITVDQLPILERAFDDLKAIDPIVTESTPELYACRVRGVRPNQTDLDVLREYYSRDSIEIAEKIIELFEACGPER